MTFLLQSHSSTLMAPSSVLLSLELPWVPLCVQGSLWLLTADFSRFFSSGRNIRPLEADDGEMFGLHHNLFLDFKFQNA